MPERRSAAAGAWLVGLTLVALTLSPLARPADHDSFPFSSYPMFAHGRADAITEVDRALALDAAGSAAPLPPRMLGSDEVLQAASTLRQAVRRGKRASARLCRQIARRVAADPAFADAVAVDVVRERYDAVRYFAGDTAPVAAPERKARCEVPR